MIFIYTIKGKKKKVYIGPEYLYQQFLVSIGSPLINVLNVLAVIVRVKIALLSYNELPSTFAFYLHCY